MIFEELTDGFPFKIVVDIDEVASAPAPSVTTALLAVPENAPAPVLSVTQLKLVPSAFNTCPTPQVGSVFFANAVTFGSVSA